MRRFHTTATTRPGSASIRIVFGMVNPRAEAEQGPHGDKPVRRLNFLALLAGARIVFDGDLDDRQPRANQFRGDLVIGLESVGLTSWLSRKRRDRVCKR